MAKITPKAAIVKEIMFYIREILRHGSNNKCQLCDPAWCCKNGNTDNLEVFHFIGVGADIRLRFVLENLFVTCRTVHTAWHSDTRMKKKIESLIYKIKGPDYKQNMCEIARYQEKHDVEYYKKVRDMFKKAWEGI